MFLRAFKVSKDSKLSLQEKIEAIDTYDKSDLLYVLKEFEINSKDYEKDVMIAVINKLFDLGVTSI